MPVGLNVTLRDLVECRFYLEDILLDNNGTFVSGMEKKKTFKMKKIAERANAEIKIK